MSTDWVSAIVYGVLFHHLLVVPISGVPQSTSLHRMSGFTTRNCVVRKYVVSTCAETAKLAVRLGKGHDTFEEALDSRNARPIKDHNRYGIFLVYLPQEGHLNGGTDNVRLATAQ